MTKEKTAISPGEDSFYKVLDGSLQAQRAESLEDSLFLEKALILKGLYAMRESPPERMIGGSNIIKHCGETDCQLLLDNVLMKRAVL